jgi:lysozyme
MEEYHHHHHHHHESKRKKIFGYVFGVVAICSLVFLGFAVFSPKALSGVFEGGMTTAANRHLALDYDGIDVSHHQGLIDWIEVAKDTCVKFVYIKATEGSTHVDSMYERNISEALLSGLKAGSYHYLTSGSSIDEQFINFRNTVKSEQQMICPMIDVEAEGVKGWSKQELQGNLALFAKYVKKIYGVYPVIYSYSKFYNQMLAPRFNGFHLFLAHYSEEEPVVEGAGKHNIWQHTDMGVVNGISSTVDLDVFAAGTSLKDILIHK